MISKNNKPYSSFSVLLEIKPHNEKICGKDCQFGYTSNFGQESHCWFNEGNLRRPLEQTKTGSVLRCNKCLEFEKTTFFIKS